MQPGRAQRRSREAAKECSPRRKPRVGCPQTKLAPEGRQKPTRTSQQIFQAYGPLVDTLPAYRTFVNQFPSMTRVHTRSIPNVFGIVLNMILPQKRNKLLLKRLLPMMLLLPRDVRRNGGGA